MARRTGLPMSVAALALAGCAVGPEYERTELNLPAQHRADPTSTPAEAPLPDWRQVFHDEVLQALIEQALENNLDVAAARSRIREFEAQLTRARAPLFPALDLSTEQERKDGSRLTGDGETADTFTFLGLLSWELDVWGFNRRRAQAAAADLASTEWQMYARQVSLIGTVSATYYNLLAAQQQLTLTRSTVDSRRETLRIQRLRNDSGMISGLEVAQAEFALAEAEKRIPRLENQKLLFENQLQRLLGQAPSSVDTDALLQDLTLTDVLPPGLPAELVERRPDVRIAELGLIAANAEVGVAIADLLPRIALTGEFGNESLDLSDLLKSGGRTWVADVSVAQPVFNAGARRAAVDAAWAQRDQAELAYVSAVLRALEDVSNSLSTFSRAGELAESTETLRNAAREYLRLASARYSNGVIGYIDVLVAQRQFFDAELELIEAIRDRHLSVALLYRSLGGGWTAKEVDTR